MTENENRMKLLEAPTAMAAKIARYMGPVDGLELTSRWVCLLVRTRPLPLEAMAFWIDVAKKLKGLQLSECEPNSVSAFDRARLTWMRIRVGMTKGGTFEVKDRRAAGAPIPRKTPTHVRVRRTTV